MTAGVEIPAPRSEVATFLVVLRFRAIDLPADRRAEILAAERVRGVELFRAAKLARIWRLPGGADSVSIWTVVDADDLHDVLASLPIAPWTQFDVSALSHHPLEAEVFGTTG